MKTPAVAELQRIFIGKDDKYKSRPLYEVLVELARQEGLAGATVLRGLLGCGAHSHLHTHSILRMPDNLLLVIEIVDRSDKIGRFLTTVDEPVKDGFVTSETVRVLMPRKDIPDSPAGGHLQ